VTLLVDTHAHLDHEDFAGEVDLVIARAREAGVSTILTVASSLESARRSLAIASSHPGLFSTAGIHPHDAAAAAPTDIEEVGRIAASSPLVVAIGETGLDYHYDFSPRPAQRENLARNVELAKHSDRPLVLHVREAHDDLVAILREIAGLPVRGVVHCFSGTVSEAHEYLEMGLLLSFSGIVTFPRSAEVREAAASAPLDRILVETDAPYLAPVPHRGRRNEPALVVHTAALVASLRGIPLDELARATGANARSLFALPEASES
jgi:TatD DNase family protein